MILAGAVRVDGEVVRKAGTPVSEETQLEMSHDPNPYVSRGGLKLASGLERFAIRPTDWTVVDVGASTGGFTDCWLRAGARQVYAVDVGYGQLAWRLRQDPRVVVLERTNARFLSLALMGRQDPVDAASVDASFIGLKLLLAPLAEVVASAGIVIGLIKPQFEAGPQALGKGGVVRDPETHRRVLATVLEDADRLGWGCRQVVPSPLRGPEGNIEFLALFERGPATPIAIEEVVLEAWEKEERLHD